MSSDAILDLTAAVVVFGSALAFANWEKVSRKLKKLMGQPKAGPKAAEGSPLE